MVGKNWPPPLKPYKIESNMKSEDFWWKSVLTEQPLITGP